MGGEIKACPMSLNIFSLLDSYLQASDVFPIRRLNTVLSQ